MIETAAGWNYADVWEAVAERFPEAPALLSSGHTTSWADFERRAAGIAGHLVASGLGHQAKVAQYLHNCPEYLESVFAAFKAALVPVNTNYRYTGEELRYLWANAEVTAVVFHGAFTRTCAALRDELAHVVCWLWVDDGTGACPDWATPYEEAAAGPPPPPVERSGNDLFLLYTGGTTGHPKGVMWRQDTLFRMLAELNGRKPADDADAAAHAAALARPGPRVLPAPPLMHGTAMWFAMPALDQGGCVVTINSARFDPAQLLSTIVADGVKGLCIVGDAFARPIADALDADPERWDLTGLRVLFSSGVMFSPETKARVLAHATRATIVDSLGSSESGGMAKTLTAVGDDVAAAEFRVGPTTRVVDDDGVDVVPGSGQQGRLAIAGHIPIGYYGDPEKTAATFLTIDGRVHVVAGDWAEVEADGRVRLLGRGSVCINTGGEKVFPEEVEEALKRLPGIADAIVVGLPDDRFGEVVAALIEAAADVDVAEVRRLTAEQLANYKVPRHVVVGPADRAANGKADYAAAKARITEVLARQD